MPSRDATRSFRGRASDLRPAHPRYRVMATMIGTVNTSDSVERRSADAASDSIALYLAASSTTIVAKGKLQQTSASRANGLCTSSR